MSCGKRPAKRLQGDPTRQFRSLMGFALVICRVIYETPAAYKGNDQVMAAQQDPGEIMYTLKQAAYVKG